PGGVPAGPGVYSSLYVKPELCKDAMALLTGMLVTSGTSTPPPEIKSVTWVVGGYLLPGLGVMWSTSPCGRVDCASGWRTTLLKPALASFCCACCCCRPWTLGSRMFAVPEET